MTVTKRRKPTWATKRKHPFETSASDHAETPLDAYRDLRPALMAMGAKTRIYDPYYADGGVVKKLAQLGFTNVINECCDFYTSKVPDYDILVTNPPYSVDHIERLVSFVIEKRKPFALLLPTYVLGKDYWIKGVETLASHPFYCVPTKRYVYEPPSWARSITTSPFLSAWFCWLPVQTTKINFEKHRVHVYTRASDVKSEHRDVTDPLKKRLNPRQRRKLKEKRAKEARKYDDGRTL